jgi:hypothetical protein
MSNARLSMESLPITPTWVLLQDAIKSGKPSEALNLVEQARTESENNNDILTSFIEQVLTHLASFKEEAVAEIIRQRYSQSVAEWLATTPGVRESLVKCVESQRRHQARFTVKEEPDRYVVTYDPCGTGGRLRRARSLGVTKKAYPWSWGKKGFPYYCSHCCIHFEILPIEQRGYPIRITLPGESPEDPCVHLFYKNPNLIPKEYFEKVGMQKGKDFFENDKTKIRR